MKRNLIMLAILLTTSNVHAGVMAKGKITIIDSSTSAPGSFAIKVEGSGGEPCNGNPHALLRANFPDEKSFDRAFTIALTAFASGATVEIHNHPDSASCPFMNNIRIIKG